MPFVERVELLGDAHISEATAIIVTKDLIRSTTIDEVANASVDVATRLSSLGISGKCDVVLDTTPDGSLIVRLSLAKLPTISARVGTTLSSELADVSASLSIRNVSGKKNLY